MDTFLEVVHLPFKLAIAFQLESNQFKSCCNTTGEGYSPGVLGLEF